MDWPNNNDGEILRRLKKDGIDFSKSYVIEFNVDFNEWPPHPNAVSILNERYGNIKLYEPDEIYDGYIALKVLSKISYNFVKNTQQEISDLVGQFDAYCNSWAVLTSQEE